jgi:hypothetical protein
MDRESTKENFQKRQNKILRKIGYFDFRLLGNPMKRKARRQAHLIYSKEYVLSPR